jgi:hypothetical protein
MRRRVDGQKGFLLRLGGCDDLQGVPERGARDLGESLEPARMLRMCRVDMTRGRDDRKGDV